ncbi:histidine-containing phosphotransfer peotein [Marchantia polymorpha subsp. ruderalis]
MMSPTIPARIERPSTRHFKHHRMIIVKNLYNDGWLNSHFHEILQLQDADNPAFVREILSLYVSDSRRLINLMNRPLGMDTVNYKEISVHVRGLLGSSLDIGAERISKACLRLFNGTKAENKEETVLALKQLTSEFNKMKPKLEHLVQMERLILQSVLYRGWNDGHESSQIGCETKRSREA